MHYGTHVEVRGGLTGIGSHHVGPEDPTQVIKLAGGHLSWRSHVAGPTCTAFLCPTDGGFVLSAGVCGLCYERPGAGTTARKRVDPIRQDI